MSDNQKCTLEIRNDRIIEVPTWLCKMLLKISGIRSRKHRHVKKAIKKELHTIIRNFINKQRQS